MAFSAIAEVRADVVALAGGLFAGLPGGLVVASQRVTGDSIGGASNCPLQAAVAAETLAAMSAEGLPASASDSMHRFAVALAEQLSGFEFVRDIHHLGMTVGIEFDVESSEVVAAAKRTGLRIEAAGDVGIRIQLPLVISDDDQRMFLDKIAESMELIERDTAELGV